jgi:peptidoglycan hydrolase CwlO-like protein
MDKTSIISAASTVLAALGSVIGALKTPKGRKILASFLAGDSGNLDTRIQAAISAAVQALQAALDTRGEELKRLESELADLNKQVRLLKEADDWKTSRIQELEAEISELRAENEVLKAELARRRGGRPKKAAE